MSIKNILAVIMIIIMLLMVGCTVKQVNYIEEDTTDKDEIIESNNKEKEDSIDIIKLQIEEMTLEEKIGQLVLVGMEGYEVNDNIKELIKSYHVGGVILYGKNVEDSRQLLSLINSLKDNNYSNKVPLFISVDEEGGSVSRNPNEVKKLPAARSIGMTEDNALAFESGKLLGQTVKAFGYNMNFAPVLDIDSNPLNPVIGDRSFGQTVDIVSSMGIEVIAGMKSQGVIPVIKHFPGHGDTAVDSHIGLPVINHNLERLSSFEILPFKDAIDNGADVVMVAHILLNKIDTEYPASMSTMVIRDILRDNLGFDGVVITDDMTMGAITKNYKIGDAALKSLVAGVDILLVGHNYNSQLEVINAIKHGVDSGIISINRIDKSVYRILKLKEEYKLKDKVINDIYIEEINGSIKTNFK